jgi:Arc/MetJ-type ribon-helix-helix transcriptional regulator
MIIGMTDGRPKAKIAITIRPDLLDHVRTMVSQGRSPNVSAFVEQAVEAQIHAERALDDTLDELLEASGGPLAVDEVERIEREFGWIA